MTYNWEDKTREAWLAAYRNVDPMIPPDLRAECEAAGLLDPIDPDRRPLGELLAELRDGIRTMLDGSD